MAAIGMSEVTVHIYIIGDKRIEKTTLRLVRKNAILKFLTVSSTLPHLFKVV